MENLQLSMFVSKLTKQNVITMIQELSCGIPSNVYPFSLDELDQLDDFEVRKRLEWLLSSAEVSNYIYQSLNQYEKEALHSFIFFVGQDLLTYRQIEQGVHGIKPYTFRIGLTGLRRKGIIYTIRRQWGEVAYVLPQMFEETIYPHILDEQKELEECEDEVKDVQKQEISIIEDIFSLMDDFRTRPECKIPLTQKGVISKRHVRFWTERWPERNQDLEVLSLPFDHRDIYSTHVILVLDFLTTIKVLTWSTDSVRLDLDKVSEWMKKSRIEMAEQFLDYWIQVIQSSTPWLKRYLKDMVIEYKKNQFSIKNKDNSWRYLLSIIERWEERYSLPSIEKINEMVLAEIIHPLHALGLLELGVSSTSNEQVWRWSKKQEMEGNIWIQPTQELLCPNILPYESLWTLTKFLSFNKWDSMLVLTTDPQKIKLARKNEISEWIDWLKKVCVTPIPPSFEEHITHHKQKFNQAQLYDMTILEIEDEDLASAMKNWSELKDIELRQVHSTLFLVPIADREIVAEVLRKKGISLSSEAENDKQNIEYQSKEVVLIKSRMSVKTFDNIENTVPDFLEAFPTWNRLPEMWKKQFHKYHEKTKREMVEQAIEQHLHIKIEELSGGIRVIIPQSCKYENGNWICYDDKKEKIPLDQINRVQLLLPDWLGHDIIKWG